MPRNAWQNRVGRKQPGLCPLLRLVARLLAALASASLRLRVEAAKEKLESGQIAVNQIVWHIGYEDASSFQRLFKRETGLTMVEYRQRFGGRRYEPA